MRQEAKARLRNGVSPIELSKGMAPTILWKVPVMAGLVALLVIAVLVWGKEPKSSVPVAMIPAANNFVLPEIGSLTKMSNDELTRLGVAKVNLACAKGLGNSPMKDAEAAECLTRLQQMSNATSLHTANNYYKFVKNPADYENSDIYYKIAMLITVVEKDFSVRYNAAKTTMLPKPGHVDHFYDDPADVFVLGAFGIKRTGTCSSMPVACVAVGRQLGYPLKLVSAKGHLFFRWDDGVQRMNFECTNGVNVMTDAKFKSWPLAISEDEIAKGLYLKSLSPRQELAIFLSIRGSVLNYFGKTDQAIEAVRLAHEIDPHPSFAAAAREFQAHRQQNQNIATGGGDVQPAIFDDEEVTFNRLMRSRYQQRGLDFTHGSRPNMQEPTLPDPLKSMSIPR